MNLAAIADALPNWVAADRLAHVRGVHDTALALASLHGVAQPAAAAAALLHDIAKAHSGEQLLQEAARYGLPVDDVERRQPGLLHGPVGAEIARREFGMTDPAVLQAIRLHTTGDRGMSVLDQIIYLADLIEPGRQYQGVETVRTLASSDLAAAMVAALRHGLGRVMARGWLIHPRSVAAYNWFVAGQPGRDDAARAGGAGNGADGFEKVWDHAGS